MTGADKERVWAEKEFYMGNGMGRGWGGESYLQRDISLTRMKPSVFLLEMLHRSIKFIQELISKERIIYDIPLSSRIMVRIVIPCSGKIKPFWMTEFVALET